MRPHLPAGSLLGVLGPYGQDPLFGESKSSLLGKPLEFTLFSSHPAFVVSSLISIRVLGHIIMQ